MVIEFGRWRLVPVDALNWELCHRHAATRGKNAGRESWHHMGRYYSYNTIANADVFAADQEMREGNDVVGLSRALHEYRSIVDGMVADIAAAMNAAALGEVAR